jgi:hypothetical protein
MDNYTIQTLITQGRIVGSGDVDPANTYIQLGVWQPGNRKRNASNDAYPSYVIPLSQLGIGNTVWGTITGLLSDQLDLQAALDNKYDISNPAGYITGISSGDVTGALGFIPYNATNPAGFIDITALVSYQPILGYTPENVANKSIDGTLAANSDVLYSSQKAVKTYVDASVSGVLDDRGNWDASGGAFPSTGGSGPGGSILKGDLWFVSVAGILGGTPVVVGNNFRALVDNPTLSTDWNILNVGLGFIPENSANKGIANGYASLDATGKVPANQIKYNTVISHGHNTAIIYGTIVSPRYIILSALKGLGVPSDLGGSGLITSPPITSNGRMSPIPKTGTIVSAKFNWYITGGSNTQLYTVEFNNRTSVVRTIVTTTLQLGPSFSGSAKTFVVSGLNIPVTENDEVSTIITCPTIVGTPVSGITLSVDYIIQ